VQAERKSKRSLRICRGAAYLSGACPRKVVQAERTSKRSLQICRGAAYLSGACPRKACKPSAKIPAFAGRSLRSARRDGRPPRAELWLAQRSSSAAFAEIRVELRSVGMFDSRVSFRLVRNDYAVGRGRIAISDSIRSLHRCLRRSENHIFCLLLSYLNCYF